MSVPAEILERTPGHAQAGLQALFAKGYISRKLEGADPHHILARYLDGESSAQIAETYSCTTAALSLFLIKHAETQWKDAQVIKALARKDKAQELMDVADNALDLSRAREQLKSAQWDLERVLRRIYGDDHNVTVNVVPVLNISVTPLDSATGSCSAVNNIQPSAQVIDVHEE